jgi:hypothetical protein
MADSVTDLLARCVAARLGGKDFPTIWNDILKRHALVAGRPVQHVDAGEPYLAIPLLTGQQIIVNSVGFSIR